ncbi:MAG: BTAD domain-containing putative transcriptional regulator [Pseudomonadota bacterium]
MLALTILGPVGLARDGRPVLLPVKKSLALLLLLARHPASLPRARVAAWLWPALDEPVARRNLRRELARLREAGVADAVHADGDTLVAGPALTCDAEGFAKALADGRHEEALALWRGPVADGFALGDADAFDDWLAHQRTQLEEARRRALRESAVACEAAGDAAGALARVEALLADDPLQEQQHRDAMRLLAAAGRREAALAQYERCRALLHDELGLVPMPETEALAQVLRGAAPAAVPVPVPGAPRAAAQGHRPVPEVLPFVGRSDEAAQIERAWASGRPIVVEGEAGVGKSRLAIDVASAHGPYALARCRPGDGELPYASLTRALRALAGPQLAQLPAWVGHELARLMPELGIGPPPIRSDEERARFFEACATAWQALSDGDVDAVVLDDWHLADAASRSLLGFIAARRAETPTPGARIIIVLRPELDAAAAEALRTLAASTGATHLKLTPLPGDAVVELVRNLSGASQPVRFAARLLRATGGNPFFLAETLRHLVELGLLSCDAHGGWRTPFDAATEDYRELPMPASVHDTVLARVQRLPAASRRLLEAAALADEPFAPALLAPACALSELDAVLAIEHAVDANLLHEHPAGGYAFAHDLVQQAVSIGLGETRRRMVHRRLALGAEASGASTATIATHHEASGDLARAIPYRIAAGDHAERLHVLPQALPHWRRALSHGPEPAQALELYRRLIWAGNELSDRAALQEHADALGALIAARSLAPHAQVEAQLLRCRALAGHGANEQALAELAAVEGAADDRQQAQLLMQRSVALHNLARSSQAMSVVQSALALPALPDADRIALLDMAFVSEHNAGRHAAALAYADAQLALALRLGETHATARSRYRRGIQLLQLDDDAGAEAELQAAVGDCERHGFSRTGRIALYNLTCLYDARGEHARALATAERALGLQPQLQAGALRAMLRVAMVGAHHALGDLGRAYDLARLAVDDALAQDEPSVHIIVATCVMPALALVGDDAVARRLLAAIDDASLRELVNPASEMWVALAQMELLLGRPAAAANALDRLDAAGGPSEERVKVRRAHARSALALARGNAEAALAELPGSETRGMNAELHCRGLAWRIDAQALLGRVDAETLALARAALTVPCTHALATLELHAALARAATRSTPGVPAELVDTHAAHAGQLAQSLSAYPVQRAAFEAAWL